MGSVLFGSLAFVGAAVLVGLAVVGLRDRRRDVRADLLPDDIRQQLGLWSNTNYRQGALVGEGSFLSPQFLNSRRVGQMIFGACVLFVCGCFLVAQGLLAAHTFVPRGALAPRGVTGRTFSPAGLGVAVDVPSGWRVAPPAGGFDYVLTGPAGSGEFLAASHQTASVVSPATVLEQRRSFLASRGATMSDERVGAIDGRPAIRLHYRLPGQDGRPAANCVEYDTLLGPNGSAIVVVGLSVGHTDPVLVAWITSTIHTSR